VFCNVQQVIGVIQAVVALITTDAVIDDRQSIIKQAGNRFDRLPVRFGKAIITINGLPVVGGCAAQVSQEVIAAAGRNLSVVEHAATLAKCGSRFIQPLADLAGHFDCLGFRCE